MNLQYSFLIKRTGQITNDLSSIQTSYLVTLVNDVSHGSGFLLRHGNLHLSKKENKTLARFSLELRKTMKKQDIQFLAAVGVLVDYVENYS